MYLIYLIVVRENLPLCPRFGDKLEQKQKTEQMKESIISGKTTKKIIMEIYHVAHRQEAYESQTPSLVVGN